MVRKPVKPGPIGTKKKRNRAYPPKGTMIGTKTQRRAVNKTMRQLADAKVNNVGCPPTYHPDFARQATELCKRGATAYELANFFGVNTSTIWVWSTRHQEFTNALRVSKDIADDRVERGLYEKAAGYTFQKEEIKVVRGKVVRVPVVEHVPPSERAAQIWLTNRRSDKWKDRRYNEFDPDAPLKIVVEGGLPGEDP